MMSKKIMCRKVIEDFKESSKNPDMIHMSDEDMASCVFSSTSLGIALEYLGVITPEKYPDLFEYLSHRGGIFQTYYDKKENKFYSLSFRELLNLLPEDSNEE